MRIIIAGSRTYNNYNRVARGIHKVIKNLHYDKLLIATGSARGVDRCGELYAHYNNIEYKPFLANWVKHGKAAGPIRNQEMAEYGHILIAFWDGKSKGTKDMIYKMELRNKPVFLYKIKPSKLKPPVKRTGAMKVQRGN